MRTAASAAVLLFLGCSSGGASGSGGTLGSFCNALISAEATQLGACYGGAVSDWETYVSLDAAICASIQSAISAGRIALDSTQQSACAAAFAGIDCLALLSGGYATPAACQAALRATVQSGGVCYADADCANGGACNENTDCGAGICVAVTRIAAGQGCRETDLCAAGYQCSATNGGAGTCVALIPPAVPAGQPCATGASDQHCQSGSACDASSGVCVALVRQGGGCQQGHSLCKAFTHCSGASNTCVPNPSAGGACGSPASQDPIACRPGNYCKLTTGAVGSCTALLADGAACNDGAQCLSTSCSGGTCSASTCPQT